MALYQTKSWIALVLVLLVACTPPKPIETSITDWQSSDNTAKPWTRWWWHGSSVTEQGITDELTAYAAAGIGGLELTPIYGIQGDDDNYITYLSDTWVDRLVHTLEEAERLGLGIDMATGTGWPFGGPWVDRDEACNYVAHKVYTLKEGARLTDDIEYLQKSILRTVNKPNLKLDEIKNPVHLNTNLQEMALDQVRFEEQLPLQALMAYNNQGDILDLTASVKQNKLDWVATKGDWTLYAVFKGWHGKMVERAAPGGEGNVIDHFSKNAITKYLQQFDKAFDGRNVSSLRAFFNDSYEVDDASGQGDWTPDMLEAFEQYQGYDLKDHLPALFGNDTPENNVRVKMDYRATISELLLDTFTKTWASWAKGKNAIIRNQAHGSPSNILDLYAASDIPETEGRDMIKAKMASSAGHVSGKPLIAAEAATWLGEHFTTNLADLKKNIDLYFNAGVNHIFYHGTTYSPHDELWPGRLFYAAIHANPRNALWKDYPAMNKYIERSQSFLQRGQANNDILLYLPASDRFASHSNKMLEHFDGWATSRNDSDTTMVRQIAEWMQDEGYAFDFISDKQILQLKSKGGSITSANHSYKCILVPESNYMPLTTLRQLSDLAKKGVTVIFQNRLPLSVPGLHQLAERQASLDAALETIETQGAIITSDLAASLDQAQATRETMVDHGLEYTRRTIDGGDFYFISNWSNADFDGYLSFNADMENALIYDPLQGLIGRPKADTQNGQILIQIDKGASIMLYSPDQANASVSQWIYEDRSKKTIPVSGPWTLTFDKGGPTLPAVQTLETPTLWTAIDANEYQEFSGTAIYSTTFDLPNDQDQDWILDLGKVEESASVYINNQKIGTAIGPSYKLRIPKGTLKATNVLDIHVSNSMANRIIAIERSGQRWQKFNNINISARKRENLGTDRVFTTLNWSVLESGLAGPVNLLESK